MKKEWPDECPTCGGIYTKVSVFPCSNSFHCCRDCAWLFGTRIRICNDCAVREDRRRAPDKDGGGS